MCRGGVPGESKVCSAEVVVEDAQARYIIQVDSIGCIGKIAVLNGDVSSVVGIVDE